MLQWEKTMLNDMFNLFNINTAGNSISLFEMPFKDALINNKDMRVLYNDSGDNVLSYVFIDKNNLIITDDQDTIEKVASLLLFKNIKQ